MSQYPYGFSNRQYSLDSVFNERAAPRMSQCFYDARHHHPVIQVPGTGVPPYAQASHLYQMRTPPCDSSYRYRPSSGSLISQAMQPENFNSTGSPGSSASSGFVGNSPGSSLGGSSTGTGQAIIIPVVHLGALRSPSAGSSGSHGSGPGSLVTMAPGLLLDSQLSASIPAATAYATGGTDTVSPPVSGNGVVGHQQQQQQSLSTRGHSGLGGSMPVSPAAGSPVVTAGSGSPAGSCGGSVVGVGTGSSSVGSSGIGNLGLRSVGRLPAATMNRDQEAEVDALTNILMQSMETKSSIGSAGSSSATGSLKRGVSASSGLGSSIIPNGTPNNNSTTSGSNNNNAGSTNGSNSGVSTNQSLQLHQLQMGSQQQQQQQTGQSQSGQQGQQQQSGQQQQQIGNRLIGRLQQQQQNSPHSSTSPNGCSPGRGSPGRGSPLTTAATATTACGSPAIPSPTGSGSSGVAGSANTGLPSELHPTASPPSPGTSGLGTPTSGTGEKVSTNACFRCRRPLLPPEGSTLSPTSGLSGPASAAANVIQLTGALAVRLHVACFTCYRCSAPLRPAAYYHSLRRLLCPTCVRDGAVEACSNCRRPIGDRVVRALGLPYHPGCFVCTFCGLRLDARPFTVDVHGRPHCLADFHRRYAPRCAQCGRPIAPEAGSQEARRVVAGDANYHLECFSMLGVGSGQQQQPQQQSGQASNMGVTTAGVTS